MAVSTLQTGDNHEVENITTKVVGSANVTLNNIYGYEIGKIRIYQFILTTTADISANTNLVEGFNVMRGGSQGLVTCVLYDHTANPKVAYNGYLSAAGYLRCLSDIPSGHSIRGNVVYFTT